MTTGSLSRIRNQFIGREDQLHEFAEFVRGQKPYHVYFVHGPGGFGKTWLLREMIDTANKLRDPQLLVVHELIDMYSTANHSEDGVRESLMRLLAAAAGQPGFENTRKSQMEIETAIRNNYRDETIKGMRQRLKEDFIKDCQELSRGRRAVVFFDTFERVQRDTVGAWILVDLVASLPNFRFVVASREKWNGDNLIHPVALSGFTPAEVQQFFEQHGWDPQKQEVIDAILEKTEGQPLLLELAIELLSASLFRDPAQLTSMSKNEFERTIIAPLQEIGHSLFGEPRFNQAVHRILMFMAYFNRRVNADLMRRFVEKDFLDLSSLDPGKVLRRLEREFFFVKWRPDGYVQLHDEMERLINQYVWPEIDSSGELRRELARIACEWYAGEIQKAGSDPSLRDDLQAEQLLYWMAADLEEAWDLLESYGLYSFQLNNLLVAEIKPAEVERLPAAHRYNFAANLGQRARQVNSLERGREYWKIAIDTAKKTRQRGRMVDALLGKHNCTFQENPRESLIILEEALALCQPPGEKRVEVLYETGFTYQALQNGLMTINSLQKAKAIANTPKWMATILNDLGYAYALNGEYERAERNARRGLEIRHERVQRLETKLREAEKVDLESMAVVELRNDTAAAWRHLGLSYNTLGEIKRYTGDQAAAHSNYSRALEIFERSDVKDISWQTKALHSRGEAYRRLAIILHEQHQLEESNEFEARAYNDFEDCLKLCDQYAIREKHTAYRRLGRLLHDQAMRVADLTRRLSLLDQARELFEKGYQLAVGQGQHWEELENLTELAFLVDDRLEALKGVADDHTLTQDQINAGRESIGALHNYLQKHEKDQDRISQFQVFVHLYQLEEGAFHFALGEYDTALKYYLDGYIGLALTRGYGVARYRQHRKHLRDQINKLSDNPERVRQWGEAFITAWNEPRAGANPDAPSTRLRYLHPDLVEEMQIYLDTAFLDFD